MAIALLPGNVPAIMQKMVLYRAPAFQRIGAGFDSRRIDKNTGQSVILTRWVNAAISTTPEPEGQNPPTQALQQEQYTGTMQRYSAAFATSTLNATLNPLAWIQGQADVLLTQVQSTRERIRWNAAQSGTNVIYNSPAIVAPNGVNGVISLGRIQKAVQSIEASKGVTFTSESGGTTKVGTSPVEAGYYCFVHTDAHPDIRNLPGFTKKAEMSPGNYPRGTFGCVDNVIFVTSPEFIPAYGAGAATTTLKATAGATDVYSFVVCAKGALTDIALEGNGKEGWGNAEVYNLNGADKSDWTNSRQIVAAAWFDLAMLTSFDWLVNIKCGVTANPA